MPPSYLLMHVPERTDLLPVIAAEFPDVRVVTDHNRAGVWPTARLAWRLGLESGAEQVCVLQDDMLPAHGAAEAIAGWSPWQVHSAFQPSRPDHAAEYHATHRETYGHACVQGGTVVMPARMVADFLDWAPERSRYYDDDLISMWLRERSIAVTHHWPPLFRHVGWNRSTIGSPAERWREGTPCPTS